MCSTVASAGFSIEGVVFPTVDIEAVAGSLTSDVCDGEVWQSASIRIAIVAMAPTVAVMVIIVVLRSTVFVQIVAKLVIVLCLAEA